MIKPRKLPTMKKFLFAFFAFNLLAVVCCQDESGIAKEKKAIKAVIEAEKTAYYDQNLAGLDGAWIQESSSRKLFMTPHGITELDGWEEIHQNNVEETEMEWDETVAPAKYSNYVISVYGSTALVMHDSDHHLKIEDEESTLKMRRILHLVKLEDEWKIDFMAMYFFPHGIGEEDIEM
jgi:hypothetical protein